MIAVNVNIQPWQKALWKALLLPVSSV